MGGVNSILVLLGYFLGARCILRVPTAYAPVVSVSCIGVLLFVANLCGYFALAEQLLMWLGWWLLVVGCIVGWCRDLKTLWRSAAIYVALLLACVSFGLLGQHLIHFGDELHYWGILVRHVFMYHALPGSDAIIHYRDYPPGTALFHAWVNYLLGSYRDNHLYFSQQLLMLSALFVVGDLKKSTKVTLAAVVMLICLALFSPSFLYSLLVDAVLACFFVAVLVIPGFLGRTPKQHGLAVAMTVPVLAYMVTIKQVGLFLAMVAVCLMAAMIVYRWLRYGDQPKVGVVVSTVSAILAIAVMTWLWRNYMLLHGITYTFHAHAPLTSQQAAEIVRRFAYAFFVGIGRHSDHINRLGMSPLMVLCVLAVIYALIIRKTQRAGDYVLHGLVLLLGALVFSAGLLQLYLHRFSFGEAMKLASMMRYLSIYFMAWVAVACLEWIRVSSLHSRRALVVSVGLAVLSVALLLSTAYKNTQSLVSRFHGIPQLARHVRQQLDFQPEKQLFVIYQQADGLDYDGQIVRYYFYPQMPFCSNLSCFHDQAQLCHALRGYRYLLVIHTVMSFAQQFPVLHQQLTNTQPALYKIAPSKSCVSLDAVPVR